MAAMLKNRKIAIHLQRLDRSTPIFAWWCILVFLTLTVFLYLLWPPYVIGHIIFFVLWFLLILLLSTSFFFSSPNLSRRRLHVYHTSTHGVALVRIFMQFWNVLHAARWKCRTQKNSPSAHHRTTLSDHIFATMRHVLTVGKTTC